MAPRWRGAPLAHCLRQVPSRMCSSRSCFGAATSAGAPIIRSSARWFIGNITTSRRFSSPASIITMRRYPAMSPWGGAPFRNARNIPPTSLTVRLAIAADSERLFHHVRGMVADRPARQFDAVDTMSYWYALRARGSCVSRARGPPAASRTGYGRSRSASPPRSTRTSDSRPPSAARISPFTRPSFIRRSACARAARELGGLVDLVAGRKNTASPAFSPASRELGDEPRPWLGLRPES